MKIKVSDYIANFFVENGIKTIFTVVGGGAMHLNDSFGHHNGLKCIYNHHEQASAMAAEAYYRINCEMAGVCVTSGPGAINALNGVAGAYQDSIPMIIISGQTKSTLTVKSSGLNLRTLGNQEFDIVSALKNFVKYSEMIMDANRIKYCLEKSFFLAKSGRPGPCWLDIPLDIQGKYIETDELISYQPKSDKYESLSSLENKINVIHNKIESAKRPIIYAGNGINIANAKTDLLLLSEKYNIPIVTCWNSIDLISSDSRFFAGRAGTMGDRAGNFAVQNSDLLICLGTRLNIYQVGYNVKSWAREAYVIDVDIDSEELKKPTIRVDLAIHQDLRNVLKLLLDQKSYQCPDAWVNKCNEWINKYPVVDQKKQNANIFVNPYLLVDKLSQSLKSDAITVVGNGSASVVGSATYKIKDTQRFVMNCAISSMGYDLPASIGVCASVHNKRDVICLTGDGSIMMNIQELQTIVTNNMNIKIVIINNDGYQQIRLTQTNLFNKRFVGLGPDSGDLGFPDFEKVAYAFGLPYKKCSSKSDLELSLEWLNSQDSYCILEVLCDKTQIFEPKSSVKRMEDGTLISPPLEDLYPFLSEDELRSNLFVKEWKD